MAELGIRQWWLAEQIGVDRKTVIRWIQGQVRSIQNENVQALAQVLNCKLDDLILANEADHLATIEDQKRAASLIIASSLIDKLGPIGEWNVIEAMLKATIVENLPVNVLAELYNQLTIASWRQSKIDQADLYNKKAEELSKKSGDKGVLAAALLNKANIYSWRGKTAAAIRAYSECLRLERFTDQKTIGSTLSNLGAVYYESGDLDRGEELQHKSIDVFGFHGKPMNLSISWCHLAMINLQRENLQQARLACEKSRIFAAQDDYLRGIEAAKIIGAEILAREGRAASALEMLKDGMDGFSKLGIEEGLNYEFAGRVYRLLGDYVMSLRSLRKGIDLARNFPLYLAGIYLELGKTYLSNESNPVEAKDALEKAAVLFEECEAPKRAKLVRSIISTVS